MTKGEVSARCWELRSRLEEADRAAACFDSLEMVCDEDAAAADSTAVEEDEDPATTVLEACWPDISLDSLMRPSMPELMLFASTICSVLLDLRSADELLLDIILELLVACIVELLACIEDFLASTDELLLCIVELLDCILELLASIVELLACMEELLLLTCTVELLACCTDDFLVSSAELAACALLCCRAADCALN